MMPAKQPQRHQAPEGTVAQGGNGGPTASQTIPKVEQTARENINEIREILFGDEMRWHEQRFAQLEDRLLQETATIKQEQNRRLEALSQQLAQEIKALNKRLDDLSRQTRSDGEEFQLKLEAQKNNLAAAINAVQDELTALLREEIARLGQEKTDRQSLAVMLHRLAEELKSDQKTKSGSETGEA